eukprot:9419172-Ditylum_brightwellii.AAC.1
MSSGTQENRALTQATITGPLQDGQDVLVEGNIASLMEMIKAERCESELAQRKLPGLQNCLVVVCMGCPHAIRTTEAGTQNNLRRRMPVDLILCET